MDWKALCLFLNLKKTLDRMKKSTQTEWIFLCQCHLLQKLYRLFTIILLED
jgi:hypothetical protein